MQAYSKEEIALLLLELERVQPEDVRAAFLFLTTDAKMRHEYSVRPGQHGHIYDFRYYLDDKLCYAFIPNQNSILWYFRRPLLNNFAVDITQLRKDFEEVNVNSKKEITVRINDYQEALKITEYLV